MFQRSTILYGKVEHILFEYQADVTIQTNYFGTLDVIQSFLPLLKELLLLDSSMLQVPRDG